tara:strand:- start:119 stop:1054 length:936 start_codon:yes stop_codon:yes gene_type:complete
MNLIESFREELFQIFESDKQSIYLGEDVRNAHRGIAIGMHSKFGSEMILDMPISESGFTGLALGLAIKGKNVFVEFNFAGLVYLGLDQIFNQAHKFNEMLNTNIDLKITYILPTGTRGGLAGHHSDNPYAILSHLGVKTYMPCNSFDCKKIFSEIKKNKRPTAIFLPVGAFFNEYGSDSEEDLVKYWGFYKIKEGHKFNIICTGTTINNLKEVLLEIEDFNPNIYVLTDLTFSDKTIESIKGIYKNPTIFIDDSFEKCGIANEIYKYIPYNKSNKFLCRESRNISFLEELESNTLVSKPRIREALFKLKDV